MEPGSRSSAAKLSVSRTVRTVCVESDCITYAAAVRKVRASLGMPLRRMSPEMTPLPLQSASTSSRVDLPQPDGPMIAVKLPDGSTPLTPFNMSRSDCLRRGTE